MLTSKLLNLPFCPSSSFSAEGACPYGGPTPLLLPPQECGRYLTSSPLFCPFFFLPYYMFIWGAFFPFWCLSSSTSVYQVLCENCSMCRCILDAFVGKEKQHPPTSPLLWLLNPFILNPEYINCVGKQSFSYMVIGEMESLLIPFLFDYI